MLACVRMRQHWHVHFYPQAIKLLTVVGLGAEVAKASTVEITKQFLQVPGQSFVQFDEDDQHISNT
jgi:hypothetical protein